MALWLYDMLNFPFAGKAQKIIYKRKKTTTNKHLNKKYITTITR